MYSDYYFIFQQTREATPMYWLIKSEIGEAVLNSRDDMPGVIDCMTAYVLHAYADLKIDEKEKGALLNYLKVLY